jgi:hypothetical protein
MARSDGPPNGSDHPPQNGHRAKQVAIALFIATTFGTMAILSFPVFRAGGPVRGRAPVAGGNTPAEQPSRPILPSIAPPSGQNPSSGGVAVGPTNPGTASTIPLGPSGPGGGPGPGGPPPGQPPPGGNPLPAPPTAVVSKVVLRTTLLNVATTLSKRTTMLSPAEAHTVRAILALPKELRKACMADRACKRSLKMVKKLLHELAPGKGHKHGHRGHHGGKSSTSGSEGVLSDRKHRHGHHGDGDDPNGGSGDGNGTRRHGHSGNHGRH